MDLRHVYLTDCQLITDTSLKCLAACRNLTVLNLADCVRYMHPKYIFKTADPFALHTHSQRIIIFCNHIFWKHYNVCVARGHELRTTELYIWDVSGTLSFLSFNKFDNNPFCFLKLYVLGSVT